MKWLDNLFGKTLHNNYRTLAEQQLFEAAYKGNLSAFKHAIAEGGSIDARNSFKDTPLHIAAKWGQADVVLYILEVAELLNESNQVVNAKNEQDQTPLHATAEGGHQAIVKPLTDSGADVNSVDTQGQTPLDYAIQYNRPEVCEALRIFGAKTAKELEEERKKKLALLASMSPQAASVGMTAASLPSEMHPPTTPAVKARPQSKIGSFFDYKRNK